MYLIIYHGKCPDGFTAAWAARRCLMERGEEEPEMFDAYYPPDGEEMTKVPDVDGRDVLVVDFCVHRPQLISMKARAKSLIVLDHHATHQEACAGLDYCIFDMNRSGAGLTWDYFNPGKPRPWLVDYVEDRDLWRFALPDSKAVNAFIACQEQSWSEWDRLTTLSVQQAASAGVGAELYLRSYVREVGREARRIRFPKSRDVLTIDGRSPMTIDPDDYYDDVPVINASYSGTSELVGTLARDALFAVGWFQRGDGLYQYSLRSRGDFDVAALAKAFGGGGHKAAAGFTSKVRVHD